MSGERDAILRRIRTALGRPTPAGDTAAPLEQRLADHRANTIPQRGQLDPDDQVALFMAMARAVSATVEEVESLDDVPAAIAGYLAGENLPSRLTVAPDPLLDAVKWETRPLLTVQRGKADGTTETGVTSAFAAVAETGSLMTLSGPDHPTTLNFLPDHHVVVLPRDRVVGSYEDGWRKLRGESSGGRFMPRSVSFITGPSRTGDIEQKIQLGAHGPRKLHVVVVRDAGPDHSV
ncbi:MAG: lactate utilization protein C [Alphaproteobacteria bacterium]